MSAIFGGTFAPFPSSNWLDLLDGSSLSVSRAQAGAQQDSSGFSRAVGTSLGVLFDIPPGESIVPGSLRFTLGGRTYFDRSGTLFTDLDGDTGAAEVAGSINYATGEGEVTRWSAGASSAIVLRSMATQAAPPPVTVVDFRTPVAPIRSGSVQVRATRVSGGPEIVASADLNGNINNPNAVGTVDYESGVIRVRFGSWITAAGQESQWFYDPLAVVNGKIFRPEPILPETFRFNAVGVVYLPLDADILGLDPVRLPPDGRVPVYRAGDVLVIHNTQTTDFPNPVTLGANLNLGRQRIARVRVLDSIGQVVPPNLYTINLETGVASINVGANLAAYTQPLRVEHRVEDLVLATDVQITGRLSISQPLTHSFPAGSSFVSSALIAGDLTARASGDFSQQSWTFEWSDSRIGPPILAAYNTPANPIVVQNRGAISERWALIFTSSTAFRIVGESLGEIGTGNTGNPCAPVNANTGTPYFSIDPDGWGTGWAPGNVFRFNTFGAGFPIWVARTVLQGPSAGGTDKLSLQIRGDVDN